MTGCERRIIRQCKYCSNCVASADYFAISATPSPLEGEGWGEGATEHLKSLIRPQIPPLPYRQIAKHDATYADSLQSNHPQADHFAHAPDLAFLAFAQYEIELIFILPAYLGRLQRLAIER